jgi:hypothetical protein
MGSSSYSVILVLSGAHVSNLPFPAPPIDSGFHLGSERLAGWAIAFAAAGSVSLFQFSSETLAIAELVLCLVHGSFVLWCHQIRFLCIFGPFQFSFPLCISRHCDFASAIIE